MSSRVRRLALRLARQVNSQPAPATAFALGQGTSVPASGGPPSGGGQQSGGSSSSGTPVPAATTATAATRPSGAGLAPAGSFLQAPHDGPSLSSGGGA